MSNMKNDKQANLVDTLKEYNKSLAEQISRIKTFLEEMEVQLARYRKVEEARKKKITTPFSRSFLTSRTERHLN